MRTFPLVSITIATKNEEKNIKHCLESINRQTYPQNKIQVIVVDNNSTDNTKKIAKKYTSFIFNKGPERSAQRNFGMLKKSKGKYLIFLDADMTLSSKTITAAVNKMEHSNLVALYIPEVIKGNSFWSQVRNFERQFYDATVIDGLRFFKKSAFVKTGGFDEKLYACEDWDLDKKIKKLGQVGILSRKDGQVLYHHDPNNLNLKKYVNKKMNYAKSCQQYIKNCGKNNKDIKRQFGLIYRYFIVFLEKGKWKQFAIKPHLVIGFYILKTILALSYYLNEK